MQISRHLEDFSIIPFLPLFTSSEPLCDAPILIAPKKEKEGARVVPLETLGGGGGEENRKG